MLGFHHCRRQGPRSFNSRPIWLQPPPLGLLRSTWNPLMGQRPRGDGAERRRAEGCRKLSDRYWRRKGEQEESQRQAGFEASTSGYSVSLDCQLASGVWLKLFREFINLLGDVFPPLILQDQDCFAGEAGAEELLALLPASAQVEPLRKKWTTDPDRSSEEKWDDIRNQVKIHGKKSAPGVSCSPRY